MNTRKKILFEENDGYGFSLSDDKSVLSFFWKHIEGLSVEMFGKGSADFAARCKNHKPARAVVDAAELDQNIPTVAWLRGQSVDTDKGDYTSWWVREIVPFFHDAGIVSPAVGTGDPNAPGAGERPEMPPGVNFRVGYFSSFDSALNWNVG